MDALDGDVDVCDAAREAKLCGAIESMGTLCDAEDGSGFDSRKFNTSLWD